MKNEKWTKSICTHGMSCIERTKTWCLWWNGIKRMTRKEQEEKQEDKHNEKYKKMATHLVYSIYLMKSNVLSLSPYFRFHCFILILVAIASNQIKLNTNRSRINVKNFSFFLFISWWTWNFAKGQRKKWNEVIEKSEK